MKKEEKMRKLGILEKLTEELTQSPFEAVLVFGYDNIRYMTGAVLPFLGSLSPDTAAVFWKKNEEPVVIVPSGLRDTMRAAGRIRNVQGYAPLKGSSGSGRNPLCGAHSSLEDAVKYLAEKSGLENADIGLTKRRISAGLLARLQKRLQGCRLSSCDAWISGLRMIKTPAEQELLAEAAKKTDHGLAGAGHHVMVYAARPEKGLSEIIRVHCVERGLDMVGYESLAVGASGEHAAIPWPEAPFFGVGKGKQLAEGELVRMEIRTSLDGYWSDAARLITMGTPTEGQLKSYDDVVAIRKKAVSILQPGLKCSEAARELLGFCRAGGIDLVEEHGLGHGIGVCPVEPPFIDPSDDTVLKEGMVLVLTPTVKGPEGELVRSYDTLIVQTDGVKLVGWYKDWNGPYKAVKSYQHGGG